MYENDILYEGRVPKNPIREHYVKVLHWENNTFSAQQSLLSPSMIKAFNGKIVEVDTNVLQHAVQKAKTAIDSHNLQGLIRSLGPPAIVPIRRSLESDYIQWLVLKTKEQVFDCYARVLYFEGVVLELQEKIKEKHVQSVQFKTLVNQYTQFRKELDEKFPNIIDQDRELKKLLSSRDPMLLQLLDLVLELQLSTISHICKLDETQKKALANHLISELKKLKTTHPFVQTVYYLEEKEEEKITQSTSMELIIPEKDLKDLVRETISQSIEKQIQTEIDRIEKEGVTQKNYIDQACYSVFVDRYNKQIKIDPDFEKKYQCYEQWKTFAKDTGMDPEAIENFQKSGIADIALDDPRFDSFDKGALLEMAFNSYFKAPTSDKRTQAREMLEYLSQRYGHVRMQNAAYGNVQRGWELLILLLSGCHYSKTSVNKIQQTLVAHCETQKSFWYWLWYWGSTHLERQKEVYGFLHCFVENHSDLKVFEKLGKKINQLSLESGLRQRFIAMSNLQKEQDDVELGLLENSEPSNYGSIRNHYYIQMG